MTRKKSLKESTTKELAIGGGMMLVFLPMILFALVGIGYLFVVMLPLALFQLDSTFISIVGVISGVLLFLILAYLWKFQSRFRLLIGRWMGLRRENRRVAETVDTTRLALDKTRDSDMPLDDDTANDGYSATQSTNSLPAANSQ